LTWTGDDTGGGVQQTVLKNSLRGAILIVGFTSGVPVFAFFNLQKNQITRTRGGRRVIQLGVKFRF
jgi:hypothetical protein